MKKNTTVAIAFRVDEKLANRYRVAVNKSGYKHSHLISIAMERIIRELEDKENTQS